MINIPNRSIHLDVPEQTLNTRREVIVARGPHAWTPANRQRVVSPALQAYAALTTNAARGAVRDVTQIKRS